MNDLNRRVALQAVFRLVLNNPQESRFQIGNNGVVLKHTNEVLNFLRDGKIPLPETIQQIDELKREAEMLNMPELVDFIETEENRGPPFFRGDKVEWKDKNPYRMFQSLNWNFDGNDSDEGAPLCFRPNSEEDYTCPLCGITTEQLREIYPDNYRSIFSEPRTATQSTGCIWKVHADSCCVDVSFAMFSYVYHIPAKLLQLTDSDNSVT
ncbi:hypothetical protein WR25_22463 [Diploscapter pachys]|uniref:Potassium channel tetramerisation-type BTB domain-containing protein n=1 Tax=Diploscapter pachys TaxID=2018661 RepID=A0A2A2KDK5_9BILA|nr:hypothetical protein WR25_22463 [Diploscapter pachys]